MSEEDPRELRTALNEAAIVIHDTRSVLVEIAKLWPGHQECNFDGTPLNLARLIYDSVQGDRAKIAESAKSIPALTAAMERADATITDRVERHLICKGCAVAIFTVQRDELKRTVLRDVIRERAEAAEA